MKRILNRKRGAHCTGVKSRVGSKGQCKGPSLANRNRIDVDMDFMYSHLQTPGENTHQRIKRIEEPSYPWARAFRVQQPTLSPSASVVLAQLRLKVATDDLGSGFSTAHTAR
eukprot:1189914-Prorocentrum_minimum.AAC.5